MTTSDTEPTAGQGQQQVSGPQPPETVSSRNTTNVYVLLAIIFGIFTYLSFTPPIDKLQWPTTRGMVTNISYEQSSGTPTVHYEYSVNEQKYTRSEPLPAWLTTTIVDQQPLVVIYSPTDPKNSEFLPGINPATYLLGSVSLVLLVMSFIAVMKTMSQEASEQTADAASSTVSASSSSESGSGENKSDESKSGESTQEKREST